MRPKGGRLWPPRPCSWLDYSVSRSKRLSRPWTIWCQICGWENYSPKNIGQNQPKHVPYKGNARGRILRSELAIWRLIWTWSASSSPYSNINPALRKNIERTRVRLNGLLTENFAVIYGWWYVSFAGILLYYLWYGVCEMCNWSLYLI